MKFSPEKLSKKVFYPNKSSENFNVKEEFDVYFRNKDKENPYVIIRNDKEKIGEMFLEKINGGLKLKGITVEEKYRGQGVGSYLFEWALNNVKEPIVSMDKDQINDVEIPKILKKMEEKGYKIENL
jgi:GNAT superfamily N-acetyltransferase